MRRAAEVNGSIIERVHERAGVEGGERLAELLERRLSDGTPEYNRLKPAKSPT